MESPSIPCILHVVTGHTSNILGQGNSLLAVKRTAFEFVIRSCKHTALPIKLKHPSQGVSKALNSLAYMFRRRTGKRRSEKHLRTRIALRTKPGAADDKHSGFYRRVEYLVFDIKHRLRGSFRMFLPLDLYPVLWGIGLSIFAAGRGTSQILTNMPAMGGFQLATSPGKYFSQASRMSPLRFVYSSRRLMSQSKYPA